MAKVYPHVIGRTNENSLDSTLETFTQIYSILSHSLPHYFRRSYIFTHFQVYKSTPILQIFLRNWRLLYSLLDSSGPWRSLLDNPDPSASLVTCASYHLGSHDALQPSLLCHDMLGMLASLLPYLNATCHSTFVPLVVTFSQIDVVLLHTSSSI